MKLSDGVNPNDNLYPRKREEKRKDKNKMKLKLPNHINVSTPK